MKLSSSDCQASSKPTLIVLDFRRAQIAPHSGVGRYVQGLADGISLAIKQESHSCVQLQLAVSADYSQESSGLSYFRSASRSDSPVFERPRFLWSTLTLKQLLKKNKETRVFWIAPDNVDRPFQISQMIVGVLRQGFLPHLIARHLEKLLLWFQLPSKKVKILQIVHDVIPVQFPSPASWMLRFQMKFFFGVLAQHGAKCVAVSDATRWNTLRFFPKVGILGPCLSPRIDQSFVQAMNACFAESRSEVFERLCEEISGLRAAFEELLMNNEHEVFFVLGVGRDEPYKCWKLVPKILEALGEQKGSSFSRFVFIHVCPDWNRDGKRALALYDSEDVKLGSVSFSPHVTLFPKLTTLRLTAIGDLSLARLYRFANCLVHPSECEGFGFPIAEAYLAGLPVVFRKSCGFFDLTRALDDLRGLACLEQLSDDSSVAAHFDLQTDSEFQFRSRGAIAQARLASETVRQLLLGWESVGAELLRLAKRDVK